MHSYNISNISNSLNRADALFCAIQIVTSIRCYRIKSTHVSIKYRTPYRGIIFSGLIILLGGLSNHRFRKTRPTRFKAKLVGQWFSGADWDCPNTLWLICRTFVWISDMLRNLKGWSISAVFPQDIFLQFLQTVCTICIKHHTSLGNKTRGTSLPL